MCDLLGLQAEGGGGSPADDVSPNGSGASHVGASSNSTSSTGSLTDDDTLVTATGVAANRQTKPTGGASCGRGALRAGMGMKPSTNGTSTARGAGGRNGAAPVRRVRHRGSKDVGLNAGVATGARAGQEGLGSVDAGTPPPRNGDMLWRSSNSARGNGGLSPQRDGRRSNGTQPAQASSAQGLSHWGESGSAAGGGLVNGNRGAGGLQNFADSGGGRNGGGGKTSTDTRRARGAVSGTLCQDALEAGEDTRSGSGRGGGGGSSAASKKRRADLDISGSASRYRIPPPLRCAGIGVGDGVVMAPPLSNNHGRQSNNHGRQVDSAAGGARSVGGGQGYGQRRPVLGQTGQSASFRISSAGAAYGDGLQDTGNDYYRIDSSEHDRGENSCRGDRGGGAHVGTAVDGFSSSVGGHYASVSAIGNDGTGEGNGELDTSETGVRRSRRQEDAKRKIWCWKTHEHNAPEDEVCCTVP